MAMVVEHINARAHCWEILGFVGDGGLAPATHLGVAPVLGDDQWLLGSDLQADLVIGIGYPKVRARVLQPYLNQSGRFNFPNLVHPTATCDFRRVELGRGNVITAGCALTCDIEINDFNLFNLNVTVGHDDRIGSYNVFNPSVNLSGGVQVGDRVLGGTGCQVLENLYIGDDATIGAGAVVTRNVLAGQTVVGIPAKPLPGR
jgi:sugar O-acyltransferase (sialic acid O-acetyltransferase NeuD family)